MALKRPNAISFSKKNTIRPFEDPSSLEFWAHKNDASLFLIAQSTKKRPNNLILARTFDSKLLDMCELGIDGFVSMDAFKSSLSGGGATPGHKPLMHFASPLFDSHPRFGQVKSMLMAFFNAEVIESICLKGLEHVISISLAPSPPSLSGDDDDEKNLPKIHLRTYTTRLLNSGTRIPRVELTPMGPSLDISLRRHTPPDPTLLSSALRQPKLKKKDDIESGLGKKRKNREVDEMGDLRGRVHVGKQDLGRVQVRKMKGLKGGEYEGGGSEDGDSEEEEEGNGRRKKRKSG